MSDGPIRTTKGAPVYPQVERAIAKLGRDISLARRSRRITAEEFAARMGITRNTLHRLETGDPGIALNTLCMAMFALGRLDAVAALADPSTDDVGMMMARQAAPRRVQRTRGHRPRATAPPADGSLPGAGGETVDDADGSGYVGF